MRHNRLIVRLAAANPVPTTSYVHQTTPFRMRPLRAGLAAMLAAAAIGIPAVAFADDIGGLFGFSNQGTPVDTSSTPFTQASALNDAMEELGFPTTLQLLGQRDGISFYAARKADGSFCFAVDSGRGKGVGCDLSLRFPSPARPIIDFSRFSGGVRLAGFAADGVSRVALVDPAGATIVSAPVIGNIYAAPNPGSGAVGVEALDAEGNVVYARSFHEEP